MINLISDSDIFLTKAPYLINPVNTIGVPPKGDISVIFKQKFPNNFRFYTSKCVNGLFKIGDLIVFNDRTKNIINFPTKDHFKGHVTLDWLESGMVSLRKLVLNENIPHVAFPIMDTQMPLNDFKNLIDGYLGDLNIQIDIHTQGLIQ